MKVHKNRITIEIPCLKASRVQRGQDHKERERQRQMQAKHKRTRQPGRQPARRDQHQRKNQLGIINDPASFRISARLHHQKRSKHRVRGLIHEKSLNIINQRRRLLAFRRDKKTHEDRRKDANHCSFETSASTFALKQGACPNKLTGHRPSPLKNAPERRL